MIGALRLRQQDKRISVRLRGPEGGLAWLAAPGAADRVVAVIGPAGPPGSGALRIDVTAPAATWILPHPFGRVPMVQVYLASGELIGADVVASATTITVTHAAPLAGFVVIT